MADGTIDRLSIDIAASSSGAARNIEQLAASLTELRGAVGDGASRLDGLAKSMSTLKTATQGIALASVASNIGKIADALNRLPADASSKLSGLSALSGLSNIKVSSTVAKSLQGVSQAVASMPEGSTRRLAEFTASLAPLSSFNGVRLGQLGKLPAVMREFSQLNVSGLAAQMRELNAALGPLSRSVERLAVAYGSMPKSMRAAGVAARSVASANQNLTRATNELTAANSKNSKTFGGMVSGMKASVVKFTAAWYVLKRTVGSVVHEVNQYVENMNLFQASMGQYSAEAERFGQKVQDLMGIDFGEWARNQGVFNTLATGMGVTADKAAVMSQQLTQLGYDISSFYNLDVQEAMLKLQSGLAGELEPLRRIGWDLSNARMNLELTKMGIEGNAESMTQAEKVAMRYKMIMEQVTITHGDMARTLASPANQIRILKAQITLAARAVGNLFIPALNAILPVAIGVVKAIRMIAQSIADLFHLDVNFEVDYSTLDTSGIAVGNDAVEETADAFDDAGKAAEKAEKKVKEYQNTVMGFDELNKLNATPEYNDDDGIGDDGGAGLGDDGIKGLGGDFGLPTYDFLEGLNSKVSKLSDDIAKNIVNALKKVIPVAAAVGTAIAGWKVANALMENLDKVDNKLNKASKSAANLSGRLAKMGNMRLAGVAAGISDNLAKARVGLTPMLQFPAKFAAAAAPWIAAIALVAGHFTNLMVNSENFRRGLEAIGGVLSNLPNPLEAISGAFKWIGEKLGEFGRFLADVWGNLEVKVPFLKTLRELFEQVAGAVMGLVEASGLLDVLRVFGEWVSGTFSGIMEVFDLQWTDAAMAIGAAIALLTGNPIVAGFLIAAEAVSLAIRAIGWATSPVIEEVDALAEVSEETAARFGTSLDSMTDAIEVMDALDFSNAVVTDEDKARIEAAVQDIHDTILNNLDAKRNEELASIEALAGVLTPEEVEAAKAKVNEYYDELTGIIDNGQAEITSIVATANAEGRALSEEESARIKQITDEQYKYLLETAGASQEEINSIQEKMANNEEAAALQAAQSVMQAAREAKDAQCADAEEAYRTTNQWASRMRDNGDITEEEYQRIMNAAEDAKEQTIKAAQEQYEGIEDETRRGLGNVADQFNFETGEIKDKWENWFLDLGSWWDWFVEKTSSGLHIGVNVYGSDDPVITPGTARFASGGFPTSGQLFMAREDGIPEMVGQMGRRTAVANNAQIVEGIELGVTNAMMQVLPSFRQQPSGDAVMVLEVDGEALARATARGSAQAARRGQLVPELAFV